MLAGRPFHGRPADVWASGVTLAYLVSGEMPFWADNLPPQGEQDRILAAEDAAAARAAAEYNEAVQADDAAHGRSDVRSGGGGGDREGGLSVAFVNDGPVPLELWWAPAGHALEGWLLETARKMERQQHKPHTKRHDAKANRVAVDAALLKTGVRLGELAEHSHGRNTIQTFAGHVFFAVDHPDPWFPGPQHVQKVWAIRESDAGADLTVGGASAGGGEDTHTHDAHGDL